MLQLIVAQGFSPAFRAAQKEKVLKRLKKRPRLKNFDYKGCYRYFITICTHDRMPLLKDAALVNQLIKALRNKSNSFGFKVWTFCFMPDHLHLLLEGILPNSDLKRFITSYKQYTGYHYKTYVAQKYKTHVTQDNKTYVAQGFSPAQGAKTALWQSSYYDHILRKDEDVLDIAWYILGNPVRKGLVKHFWDYNFMGSFEFDMGLLRQG